jgi:hypothetical protein
MLDQSGHDPQPDELELVAAPGIRGGLVNDEPDDRRVFAPEQLPGHIHGRVSRVLSEGVRKPMRLFGG